VSSWRCKGWKKRRVDGSGGALECWHITSTEIDPSSFPGLGSVIDRGFTHAVAFHGFDEPEILIGGRARAALKEEIRCAIEAAIRGSHICVRVATPDDRFGGDDPCNIVNLLTLRGAGGIQIEQGLPARKDHGEAIANAVATVYERRLRRHRPRWRENIGELVDRVRNAAHRVLDWGVRRLR
ncbi:MAG: poly-gamma-glutamate hydrolase family protein, partial [Acidimicrobiales bacterium]